MRTVFGLVLIVGMGLAGMAVYMVQNYVNQTEAQLQRQREFNAQVGNLVQVYVYNKAMAFGDPLTPDDVQVIYWPEKALPETIFRDQATLFPENAKGPRYIMRATEAFEPVLASRVTAPGEVAGLTSKLQEGMRAFAIRVGVASGVTGFVQPDDFVDIYWTGSVSGSGEVTRLIESSVQVIAVDNAINATDSVSGSNAQTVTVAATPEQVAKLAQAQSTGQLSMSLVGSSSQVVTDQIEVNTDSMLGIQREVEVAAPVVEQKLCTRRERKGTDVVVTEVPCD